ncbi:hypothetical protein [Polymorphospora rubra]|uniref:hypothetical protein n=1 Tax=Polymorphospora rubra TaxID=338584 RepID=UPI003401FE39
MESPAAGRLPVEGRRPPTDWSTAEVEAVPRKPAMTYSTSLSGDLATWLEVEATRRGVNPSAMLGELVAEARRTRSSDKTVTVRLSDLHRLIDQLDDRSPA